MSETYKPYQFTKEELIEITSSEEIGGSVFENWNSQPQRTAEEEADYLMKTVVTPYLFWED